MKKQTDVDFSNPEEHALWVTECLLTSTDQVTLAERDARVVSRQLWQAGFRHHPEEQTHEFVNVPGGIGIGATWQPINEDGPTHDVVPDISGLSLNQKVELARQLEQLGVIGGTLEGEK